MAGYACLASGANSTAVVKKWKHFVFLLVCLQERARAQELGYEDPINENYEATTAMYQKTLLECLRRIKEIKETNGEKRVGAMVASHNEDTIRFTIQKLVQFLYVTSSLG